MRIKNMKNILTKRKDYAILNFHRLKQVVFICSYLFMTDKNTEKTEKTVKKCLTEERDYDII